MSARRKEEHIRHQRDLYLSDDEIVRRICAGECDLFEQLLKRYNRRLYRVARTVLHNDVDAEDVVQETWLRAFANLRQLTVPACFAAWITRIALYEAWACARHNRRERTPEDRDGRAMGLAWSPADPERATADHEFVRLLEEAIDGLPEKYRLALILRGVEGLTAEEAARHLKVSRVTVNTRYHRARALLRARLLEPVGLLPRTFEFAGRRCRRLRLRVMQSVVRMRSPLGTGERGEGTKPHGPAPLPAVDPLVNERARSSSS